MLNYTKLWLLLEKRQMKRTDLTKDKVISSAPLAKLGKNEPVSSTVIEKLCDYLKCQPGDIMENITKEDSEKAIEVLNQSFSQMFDTLSIVTGKSKEQLIEEAKKDLPTMLKAFTNGDDIFSLSLPSEEE